MLITNIKQITQSKGFKKYFQNTTWLLLEKIAQMSISFFVMVMVARYLGPGDFGLFNFARSIASFFTILSGLGLDAILVRNLVNSQAQAQEHIILGTAWSLKFILAIINVFLFASIYSFIPQSESFSTLVLIFLISDIFKAFNVIKYYFQSKVQAKYIAVVAMIQVVVIALFRVLLIYISANLFWFVIASAVGFFVEAISLIYLYHLKSNNIWRWQFRKTYAINLIKDSWPLIFSGFVIVIYMKIDQVMIKYMMDDSAVGQYSVAVRISEVWNFIGAVVCSSLLPAVINAKNKDMKLYNFRYQRLLDLLVILALCIILPVFFLNEWIVTILFGNDYLPSASVLAIHIWSVLFIFIGNAGSNWLIAENLQKLSLYRTILGGVINVTLNFVLIPILGINGAAIATLVSQACASYLGFIISKKTHSLFILQSKALFIPSIVIRNFEKNDE